jgi:AraC family transcriptional regulator of arabinose operon
MGAKLMEPHLMGIDTRHTTDFFYDRKAAPGGTTLVMCFRTPALVLLERGPAEAGAGDFIIQPPEVRHYHRSADGAEEGFRNDWLHADSAAVRKAAARLGLPLNTFIHTGKPDIMATFIKIFSAELETDDEFSAVSIENNIFEMLLAVLRASRENTRKEKTMTVMERRHYERLKQIRADMLKSCAATHNVRKLAREAGISPERFAALYKKFFGGSPVSDIIDARVSMAKKTLLYSMKSVKETARECGFADLHYFSRIFRRRPGVSPSEYRARG